MFPADAISCCILGRFLMNRKTSSSWLILHSARIPQIIKNYREKSCEGGHTIHTFFMILSSLMSLVGLSILFFILSLLGNLS